MTKKPKDTFGPIELEGIKEIRKALNGERITSEVKQPFLASRSKLNEEDQAFLDCYAEASKRARPLLEIIRAYRVEQCIADEEFSIQEEASLASEGRFHNKLRKQLERQFNEIEQQTRSEHAPGRARLYAEIAEIKQDLRNTIERLNRLLLPEQADTPSSRSDKDQGDHPKIG